MELGEMDQEEGIRVVRVALQEISDNYENISTIHICKVISIAIQYGASIYNQGFPKKCAEIYAEAANGLVQILSQPQARIGTNRFYHACEQMRSVINQYGAVTSDNADNLAWNLRYTFDNILEICYATHAVDVINMIDEAIKSINQSDKPIDLGQVQWVIALSISKGSPIYDAGDCKDCAAIYLYAARNIVELLQTNLTRFAENSQSCLNFANQEICIVLQGYESLTNNLLHRYDWALKNQPRELAWALRKVFDKILNIDEERPLHETDPLDYTPLNISYKEIQTLAKILTTLDQYVDCGRRGWRLLLQGANLADFANKLDYLESAANEVSERLVIDLLKEDQLRQLLEFLDRDSLDVSPKNKIVLKEILYKYFRAE